MDKNNWMASDGLDFDMTVLGLDNKKDPIAVKWGNLNGDFISYASAEKRLVFSLEKMPSFSDLENGPNEATVIYGEESYTIHWSAYNYVVSNSGDIAILIEEKEQ